MSWSDIGSLLQGAGSVLQGIATIVAAIAAIWGFAAWRRQQIGLRQQQVAEEILLIVHAARAGLKDVRTPLVEAAEMADENGEIGDSKVGLLRAYQRRFSRNSQKFSDIQKAAILAEIHFGKELPELILRFHRLINTVWIAATMLSSSGSDRYDFEFRDRLQRELSSVGTPDRPDEIGGEADRVVETVMAELRPALQLSRSARAR